MKKKFEKKQSFIQNHKILRNNLLILGLLFLTLFITDNVLFALPPITYFGPDEEGNIPFKVANNTKKVAAFDPPGTDGSFFNVGGGNMYQLTDTFENQAVAMWYYLQSIDLSQDFEIDFKLFFDTGRAYTIWHSMPGDADGIAFVMHTMPINNMDNIIGSGQRFLGYGSFNPALYDDVNGYEIVPPSGVSPSYAVEFDTDYDWNFELPPDNYGWVNAPSNQQAQHISYLKNASSYAQTGTYVPIQNSWGGIVTTHNWYCASIVWKRVNGVNGNAGYTLTTYLEERVTGEMVQRVSKTFNSPSDLITGLTADNNEVYWGITASTCSVPNRQMIEFQRLINGNLTSCYTAIVARRPYTSTSNIYLNLAPGYTPPAYDTVRTCYEDSNNICKINSIIKGDTMVSRMDISCYELAYKYDIIIDGLNMSAAQWYINDELINGSAELINGRWIFPISDYFDDVEDGSIIIVKAIVNGQVLIFKLASEKSLLLANKITEAFANNVPPIEISGTTGTIEINKQQLSQSLALPEIEGCIYNTDFAGIDLSKFQTPPTIDANNTLTFELNEDVCEIDIPIRIVCLCNGQFTLHITNPYCEYVNDCDGVEIESGNKLVHIIESEGTVQLGYGSVSSFKISSKNDKTVEKIVVTPLIPDTDPNYPVYINIIGEGTDTCNVSFAYNCMPGMAVGWYSVPAIVCVYFTDETYCCEEIDVGFECKNYLNSVIISPNPDLIGAIGISYELYTLPTAPIPLTIGLYDWSGNLITTIMDEVPTGLINSVTVPTSTLTPNIYYIAVQMGNQIELRQYIKE
jgi:hypothetical protein